MADRERNTTEAQYYLLVVDDNDGMRDVLEIGLKRKGYAAATAQSAHQALEMISRRDFDLILLDIKLPDMSGLKLLKILRQARSILDTPIIMLSGMAETAEMVEALQNGANDYVTKPFDLPAVLARIETQLSLKRHKEFNNRFLKIATHDLKKPVLLILDATRVIKDEQAPGSTISDDTHETLDLIIKSGKYMQRIIEDLLEMRAIKDGHLQLSRVSADLNTIAEQAVERNLEYAKRMGIALQQQLETGLPRIWGDDFRLAEVLDNLIGNAIKFSPEGSRTTVYTRSEDKSVVLEVIDSGPGLADTDMDQLFAEYAQLSNRPTGHEKSSGIGLSICKELIGLHDGDIGARNNSEGGSTFWFRLPLAED